MTTQDPVKPTATANTEPKVSPDLKNWIMTTAVHDQLKELLTQPLFGGAGQNGPNESLVDALTHVRDQEKHMADMRKSAVDVRGSLLDNQKKEMDMDIKLAEAQQKGLVVQTQDPKPVPVPGQNPTSGAKVSEALLNRDTGVNMTKGLFDAINKRYAELDAKGIVKPVNSEEEKRFDFYQEELGKALKNAETEKKLQYGPFAGTGPLGNLIQIGAGLLDIVSGPLDIGTALFGGTIGEAGKAEMLTRAMANTSPLLRAQMSDMFNRDKMEETAQRYLEKRGLGGLRNSVSAGAIEEADQIAALAIDARRLLASNLKTQESFSSDSVTGLDKSLDAFENIHKYLDDLRHATTKEEVASIQQELVKADQAMREPYRRHLANGGTPDQFHQYIANAVDVIDKEFQPNMQYSPMGGKEEANFLARKKLVGHDLTNKLADIEQALLGNTELDIRENAKSRLTPSQYAKFEKFVTEADDVQQGTEEFDVANNPSKLTAYLRKMQTSSWNGASAVGIGESLDRLQARLFKVANKDNKEKIQKTIQSWKDVYTKPQTVPNPFKLHGR